MRAVLWPLKWPPCRHTADRPCRHGPRPECERWRWLRGRGWAPNATGQSWRRGRGCPLGRRTCDGRAGTATVRPSGGRRCRQKPRAKRALGEGWYRSGIRTQVPWLRKAAGAVGGLRLPRFCERFRKSWSGESDGTGPSRARGFKFLSRGWRPRRDGRWKRCLAFGILGK